MPDAPAGHRADGEGSGADRAAAQLHRQRAISGAFSESEARNLARVLNSGSLPVKLETQAVQTVSPTLGKDSLRAAWIAGIVGVGLVLLFMILYYKLLGVIVGVGLLVSGALIWTIISFLSKTAGARYRHRRFIVSVGVTVDSYAVFFERLKDEVRWRSMRNSTQAASAGPAHDRIADMVSHRCRRVAYLTVGSVRGFCSSGLSIASTCLWPTSSLGRQCC